MQCRIRGQFNRAHVNRIYTCTTLIAIYTELDRSCCVCVHVLDARCCMLIIASRCHVLVSCAGVCREMAAAAQSVCSWRSTHPPDPLACSRPDCLQTTCCSYFVEGMKTPLAFLCMSVFVVLAWTRGEERGERFLCCLACCTCLLTARLPTASLLRPVRCSGAWTHYCETSPL